MNSELDLTKLDFECMRPPKEVFSIKHPPEYIVRGEGYKMVRKIFYKVELTKFEKDRIEEMKKALKNENLILPDYWTDIDVLKYWYSGREKINKSVENVKKHLEWIKLKTTTLSMEAYDMLKSGVAYIAGRDKQYRPVIVIEPYRINLKTQKVESFLEAVRTILDIAKNYCFVPYHVENFIIIIETNEIGLLEFPFDIIQKVSQTANLNYQCTLEKLYISRPSFFLYASFSIIKSWLDPNTTEKLGMIKKKDYDKFLEKIDPSQLEVKYGGKMPNITKFWPPTNTINKPPFSKEINLKKEALHPLYQILLKPTPRRFSTTSRSVFDDDKKSEGTEFHDFESVIFYDSNTPDHPKMNSIQEIQEVDETTPYPGQKMQFQVDGNEQMATTGFCGFFGSSYCNRSDGKGSLCNIF